MKDNDLVSLETSLQQLFSPSGQQSLFQQCRDNTRKATKDTLTGILNRLGEMENLLHGSMDILESKVDKVELTLDNISTRLI